MNRSMNWFIFAWRKQTEFLSHPDLALILSLEVSVFAARYLTDIDLYRRFEIVFVLFIE